MMTAMMKKAEQRKLVAHELGNIPLCEAGFLYLASGGPLLD
jgi:hypothetical protein